MLQGSSPAFAWSTLKWVLMGLPWWPFNIPLLTGSNTLWQSRKEGEFDEVSDSEALE